jgi:hypothetical protein
MMSVLELLSGICLLDVQSWLAYVEIELLAYVDLLLAETHNHKKQFDFRARVSPGRPTDRSPWRGQSARAYASSCS